MYIRFLTLALLSATLLLTGAGCKGLTPEEQASIQPLTLNYWTVFNDVETLRQFASEYQQIRPYVSINIRRVRAEEFEDVFINALADDVGPDIVSVYARDIRKYQSKLAPMPPRVQVSNVTVTTGVSAKTTVTQVTQNMPSRNTIQDSFVGAVGDDVIIGEEIYGLPLAIDTLAIYYNKDLLDRSGVAVAPTTWEEFLDAVQKTTRYNSAGDILQSGVALGTGNNIENAFDILSLLMMQSGVEMTRDGRVAFQEYIGSRENPSEAALEALRFYTDFARPTKEIYSWNEDRRSALDDFIRGRSVFYFGFAYERAQIVAGAPQMNLAVIQMPQLNPEAPANVANYWIEGVTQKSLHKNEAWDFVRYISTPPNIARYVEKTGQPSPLRAQVTTQTADPAVGPFASQVLFAKNWYKGRDVESARTAFRAMIAGHLEPIDTEDQGRKRDSELIINAAQVVQQTL